MIFHDNELEVKRRKSRTLFFYYSYFWLLSKESEEFKELTSAS